MTNPISIEGRGPGPLPWLGLAVALVCLAAFGYDWQARGEVEAGVAAARTSAFEYFQQKPYLDLDEGAGALLFPDLEAEARSAKRRRLRRAYPFRVVEIQRAMDQPELDRRIGALADAIAADPARRFGLAPDSGPLSWLTYLFLHRSPVDLATSLVFLLLGACLLEGLWPRPLLGVVFLASGLTSAGLLRIVQPELSWPVVGAGGAVAGLMGASARLGLVKLRVGAVSVPAVLLPGAWLLLDLVGLPRFAASPSAWWHLAGFGTGLASALVLRMLGLEQAPARSTKARASDAEQPEQPSDPIARLRADIQANRLDSALEQVEALDELPETCIDPLILVRLGTKLAKAGRGADGAALLGRALPDEGEPLPGAVALRVAREARAINSGLAARAARCGLADPALDESLRADLTTLASAAPAPAAPEPAAASEPEAESAAESFDHGVVDLSGDPGDDGADLADAEASGEFDVNELGQNFDFADDDLDEPDPDKEL